METITLEVARDLLKRAVETQGRDFRYAKNPGTQCYYEPRIRPFSATEDYPEFSEDDPRRKTACLVGVALDLHGVTFQHGTMTSVNCLAFPEGTITYAAKEYFAVAQRAQDNSSTWGESFDAAESCVEDLAKNEFGTLPATGEAPQS